MTLLNEKNYSIYTMACNEHLSEATNATISHVSQNLNETHMTEYFAAKVNENGCLIRLYSITNTIRLCQTSHSHRLYRAVAVWTSIRRSW